MKLFYALVISIFLNNCSFDNKSGIWKNENDAEEIDNIIFKDFKKLTSSKKVFEEVINKDPKFFFKTDKPFINNSWRDIYFNKNNNLLNFKYQNLNQTIFKSKKITKKKTNNYILFDKNNLIISDRKGNIFIYSIEKNKIISSVNFYKKKFSKIEKFLNLVIEDNIVYVSDNIGYVYAYDYITSKILWAKNHKVPFRSNIKVFSNKIFTSNQNNDFFIFDKKNGNLIKLLPSEETVINNSFTNSISLSEEEIFFLNTYGSLYSINSNNFKLNWFINLNKSLDLNLSNLFFGSQVVYHDQKVFLSSNENFYIINSLNGSIISKKNFSSVLKPIIYKKYIFLITKNNFLISMNLDDGKIIYSYDIGKKVAEFIRTKKKELEIKDFILANDNIFIFLKNSHIIKFNFSGEIKEIIKLPSKINSHPIIVRNYLIYLDKNNKLLMIN